MRKDRYTKMTPQQILGYVAVKFLGMLQQWIYTHVIGDRVWRTANGECIPLSKMETSHLLNAYRMKLRDQEKHGKQFHTLIYLRDEIRSRGLSI